MQKRRDCAAYFLSKSNQHANLFAFCQWKEKGWISSNSPKQTERFSLINTPWKKLNFPSHLRETSVTSGAFIPCHTKQVYVIRMLNVSWGTTAELQCWVWDLLGGSPTTEVQALITFPACAWIQLSVLVDFAPLSSVMKLSGTVWFQTTQAFRGTSTWKIWHWLCHTINRSTWGCDWSGLVCWRLHLWKLSHLGDSTPFWHTGAHAWALKMVPNICSFHKQMLDVIGSWS